MRTTKLVNEGALSRALSENRLDALLAVYPKNVFYYSGSPIARTQLLIGYLPEDPGRATLAAVVVTENGGNTLVCCEEEAPVNQEEAWVEKIETYEAYRQSPMEAIAKVVRDKGLGDGRLGIEVEYMTVSYLEELKQLLPQAELVPSDEQFEWIRSLKTPGEIAILKEAADLLDDAMLEAFTSARVGDTEWEIHCRIIEGAMNRGAEHCRGVLTAGVTNDIRFSGTGQKRLEPGDVFRTDHAAFLRGYPGHVSRVGVVGEPNNLQRKIYANLLAGHHRIIEFMSPGVTGQEVFRFGIKAYEDLGYMTTYRTILGHNLGLGYHERPMLTEAETMPLQVTNVVALEPRNARRFHIQDQVVIEENGARLQSDKFDTRELFVLGT
jgi:Xaa-Pro aminopeptidase